MNLILTNFNDLSKSNVMSGSSLLSLDIARLKRYTRKIAFSLRLPSNVCQGYLDQKPCFLQSQFLVFTGDFRPFLQSPVC